MRTRLLEADARLLASDGPSVLSTRRVAAEAGTSTMSVYTHFGSMPDLVRGVIDEGFRRLGAALSDVPVTTDPLADIIASARAYRTNALTNPELYAVMFGSALLGRYKVEWDTVATTHLETFALLAGVTSRAIEEGHLDSADPEHVAPQMWSAVHGALLLEVEGRFPIDDGDVLTPLLANLLVGLGADREALRRSVRSS